MNNPKSPKTENGAYVAVDKDDPLYMPAQIFRDELSAIIKRRKHPSVNGSLPIPPDPDDNVRPSTDHGLIGLAISGGGIRSATFSLGVMQALASKDADVLKYMDYMSTVSGGGYSGSCLTWALYGKPETDDPEYLEFIKSMGVGPSSFPIGTEDPREAHPDLEDPNLQKRQKLLKYLREHGKYLTPGGGISALSCLGVLLRGILLNLLVWLSLVTCLIYFARHFGSDAIFKTWVPVQFLIAIGVAISLLYSVATFFRFKGSRRYWFRRGFESASRSYLVLIFVATAIGTLGWVHDLAGTAAATLSPAMIASGIGTGLWTYFRTASQKSEQKSLIPIGLVATVASLLLLYGGALGAYALANPAVQNDWTEYVALAFAATIVFGWVVNINQISLHRFYRDRLMETFLPGIERAIEGKTGAAAEADKARLADMWNDDNPRGPYHIINTNLVTVDSGLRTQRTRGGDNFILSPFYCGSTITGWRRTNSFENGAMTLATAMAISAAAANPNTGVAGKGLSRNKFVSLLMALLNLRLGYWTHRPSRSRSPFYSPNHFWPGGAYELAGRFKENSVWLQLTDGGHFENLALYELIRRRLKLIVVLDGGADANFSFADLQTAARRIQTDFGTVIDFSEDSEPGTLTYDKRTRDETVSLSTSGVERAGSSGFPSYDKRAKRGWIHGTITYAGGEKGDLIYVKTTLVDGISLTTQGYKDTHPTFPDQTTADQFFDPEQFAAYRELGYVIGKQVAPQIHKIVKNMK